MITLGGNKSPSLSETQKELVWYIFKAFRLSYAVTPYYVALTLVTSSGLTNSFFAIFQTGLVFPISLSVILSIFRGNLKENLPRFTCFGNWLLDHSHRAMWVGVLISLIAAGVKILFLVKEVNLFFILLALFFLVRIIGPVIFFYLTLLVMKSNEPYLRPNAEE